MPLDKEGPHKRKDEIGAPSLLKKRYSTVIGSSVRETA